jgi:hypothetical protein
MPAVQHLTVTAALVVALRAYPIHAESTGFIDELDLTTVRFPLPVQITQVSPEIDLSRCCCHR